MELAGGFSWDTEFSLPSVRKGEISSDDSDDDTNTKVVITLFPSHYLSNPLAVSSPIVVMMAILLPLQTPCHINKNYCSFEPMSSLTILGCICELPL